MSQCKYDYGVFIGRFQPFHVGHLHNIQEALKCVDRLVVIVGSSFRAPSIKNPFSFEERRDMILSDLQTSGIEFSRIIVEPVSDWFYDENGWRKEAEMRVYHHAGVESKIAIIGHEKDASSYYLKCFPAWQHIDVANFNGFNATDFRVRFFGQHRLDTTYLVDNPNVNGSCQTLKRFMQTQIYQDLCQEFEYITQYKRAWQDAPFKPMFVTTDAMVLCNKHLLLVQRKYPPGKNLWALPGGFLDQDERIVDGILRELNEETHLDVSEVSLVRSFINQEVFDYPERSLRGTVITHLGLFVLNITSLPKIQADDDAKAVKWVKLEEVLEKMSHLLMDDHYQIIKFMSLKYRLID